ncbi:MAG: hypothetical protein ACTSSJ_00325 [Candidatus Odinarchaeia archaeon]
MEGINTIKEKFQTLTEKLDNLAKQINSISNKIFGEFIPEFDKNIATIQVTVDELKEKSVMSEERYNRLIRLILKGFQIELNKVKSDFDLDKLEEARNKLLEISEELYKIDPSELSQQIKQVMERIKELSSKNEKPEVPKE